MSDSGVVIRKFEIPPAPVFQLELPKGAWILKIVVSRFNPMGIQFHDNNPVPFMWVLCHPSQQTETRTFVRVKGRTQLSELDAEKLKVAELVYLGAAIIPRKDENHEEVTYFIFEDESERTE